jgi:hypothetical protein
MGRIFLPGLASIRPANLPHFTIFGSFFRMAGAGDHEPQPYQRFVALNQPPAKRVLCEWRRDTASACTRPCAPKGGSGPPSPTPLRFGGNRPNPSASLRTCARHLGRDLKTIPSWGALRESCLPIEDYVGLWRLVAASAHRSAKRAQNK